MYKKLLGLILITPVTLFAFAIILYAVRLIPEVYMVLIIIIILILAFIKGLYLLTS